MTSPQLAREDWARNPFWKRYQNIEFNELKDIATQELLMHKTRADSHSAGSAQ